MRADVTGAACYQNVYHDKDATPANDEFAIGSEAWLRFYFNRLNVPFDFVLVQTAGSGCSMVRSTGQYPGCHQTLCVMRRFAPAFQPP